LLGVTLFLLVDVTGARGECAATELAPWFIFGVLTGGRQGLAGLLPDLGLLFGAGSPFPLGVHV
jgi:hypothetical protein